MAKFFLLPFSTSELPINLLGRPQVVPYSLQHHEASYLLLPVLHSGHLGHLCRLALGPLACCPWMGDQASLFPYPSEKRLPPRDCLLPAWPTTSRSHSVFDSCLGLLAALVWQLVRPRPLALRPRSPGFEPGLVARRQKPIVNSLALNAFHELVGPVVVVAASTDSRHLPGSIVSAVLPTVYSDSSWPPTRPCHPTSRLLHLGSSFTHYCHWAATGLMSLHCRASSSPLGLV